MTDERTDDLVARLRGLVDDGGTVHTSVLADMLADFENEQPEYRYTMRGPVELVTSLTRLGVAVTAERVR